jgi:hypothetical protein
MIENPSFSPTISASGGGSTDHAVQQRHRNVAESNQACTRPGASDQQRLGRSGVDSGQWRVARVAVFRTVFAQPLRAYLAWLLEAD